MKSTEYLTIAMEFMLKAFISTWGSIGVNLGDVGWGVAGGLVLMYFQEPTTRKKALTSVAVSGLISSVFTEIAMMMVRNSIPDGVTPDCLRHATSFVLGLFAQSVIKWILDELPGMLRSFISRFLPNKPT